MEKIEGEKTIAHHYDITLTNKAVVQEEKTFFGNKTRREIPLKHITSISKKSQANKVFLVFASIFFSLSIYSFTLKGAEEMLSIMGGLFVIFLFLYVLSTRTELVISSSTEKITEISRKSKNFENKLRESLYN